MRIRKDAATDTERLADISSPSGLRLGSIRIAFRAILRGALEGQAVRSFGRAIQISGFEWFGCAPGHCFFEPSLRRLLAQRLRHPCDKNANQRGNP